MQSLKTKSLIFFISGAFLLLSTFSYAEEEENILEGVQDQLKILINDMKTLEKAVYQKSDISSSNINVQSDRLNEDILTKHLLKLNEIEDQFRQLTNKFEEVNFRLDKLSTRVTKLQSDTQLRFSDIENTNLKNEKRNNFTRIIKTKRFRS